MEIEILQVQKSGFSFCKMNTCYSVGSNSGKHGVTNCVKTHMPQLWKSWHLKLLLHLAACSHINYQVWKRHL